MKTEPKGEQEKTLEQLNILCVQVGEVWRVHVRPSWLPRYLRTVFDENGEAYPVLLDFEDLDRHMASKRAEFEKRVGRGSVELTAHGDAAPALAVWLSTAFASGVRDGTRQNVDR